MCGSYVPPAPRSSRLHRSVLAPGKVLDVVDHSDLPRVPAFKVPANTRKRGSDGRFLKGATVASTIKSTPKRRSRKAK